MPRQARLDAPGTLHHVIIRGIERKEIVKHDHDRQNFVYRMGTIASETGTLIYAWTLLTKHAHIFLRSSSSGISQYMRRLLSGYATSFNRCHRRHGHPSNVKAIPSIKEPDKRKKQVAQPSILNTISRLSNIKFRLDCQSMLHICKAVCCRFPFALFGQDVEERIINWEFSRSYLIEVLYKMKHIYIKY